MQVCLSFVIFLILMTDKLQLKVKSPLIYNSTLSLVNVAKESRETLKRHDHEHKHQLYM